MKEKLEPRVKVLESDMKDVKTAVSAHLIESGEIRTDIAWIKKGVYACVAAAVSSTSALIVGIILALLQILKR